MKKGMVAVAAGVALVLAMGLCACSAEKPDASKSTQAVSAMVESTYEGVLEATGIDLPAPKGAEDVEYFYYKGKDPIAEMRFTLDGNEACLRAQSTALTAFPYEGDELLKAVAEGKDLQNGTDISGMYYTWEENTEASLAYLKAEISWNEGKEGIMLWYDMVPGVMYSLSVDSGADPMLLCSMADAVFVPVQGDVYGDGVLPVDGPVFCSIAYIDGEDIGLRALNGDEIYELSTNQDTFFLTDVAVGDVVRVLYRGDLTDGAAAVQVVKLSVIAPDEASD